MENLCYNTDDQSLYFIRGNQLVNVDVATGEDTVVASIDTDLELSGLDYSETEHCFYVVGAEYVYDFEAKQFACPTGLYTFTLPQEGQDITLPQVADFGIWPSIISRLALDEQQNAAYILRSGNQEGDLFTYEFDTDTLTLTGKLENHGNLFLEPDANEANRITREEPTSVTLNVDVMNLFVGGQKTLVAEVGPWCLKDKSMVWTSSDPAVATVDENGVITGLKEGTVTTTETERGGKTLEDKTTVTLRNCDGKTDCPSAAFTDLNTGAWYHDYTDYVLENGLMQGMGNGIFAPNGSATRGMVVTILYRMAGEPEVKSAIPFTDVAEGQYYAKAVTWSYENGIATGMTDTLFAPNSAATREQIVTFLYRYAQFAGLDVSARGDLTAFPDSSAVSDYAKDTVSWAVGTGLLMGDEAGRLLPKVSGSRVQLAALITRFLAQ